jgi:hypothetical protein
VAQELAGFASLPSSTRVEGPTSGQFITAANGVSVPFTDYQPIQGFSAILLEEDGSFLVAADNGFGKKENSSDFILRVTRLVADFRTEDGGAGTVRVDTTFVLCDPDRRISFPILASLENHPEGDGTIPVDDMIVNNRLLTGWDLDPESMRMAPDGTFWFGDEFGPFLIHADSAGRLMEAPIPLPGIQSPQNPELTEHPPLAPQSGGFEGMALSLDGKVLYSMLEMAIVGAPARQVRIYQFDLGSNGYASQEPHRLYELEEDETRISDLTALTERTFLVIERDELDGDAAQFKRIYLIDFNQVDERGYLVKRELVDLLRIPDPHNLGGDGEYFRFAFVSVEGVVAVDEHTICVINDNNYPGGATRHPNQNIPDDSEFILIRFEEPLAKMSVK